MKCSRAFFGQSECHNKPIYFGGPMRRPLCESCSIQAKDAHEKGETVISMMQAASGKIQPFKLIKIPDNSRITVSSFDDKIDQYLSDLTEEDRLKLFELADMEKMNYRDYVKKLIREASDELSEGAKKK